MCSIKRSRSRRNDVKTKRKKISRKKRSQMKKIIIIIMAVTKLEIVYCVGGRPPINSKRLRTETYI